MLDGVEEHGPSRVRLDVKWFERPEKFDGSEEKWKYWKFQFENWISLFNQRIPDLIAAAAASEGAVAPSGEEQTELGHLVYLVLATLLKGPPLRRILLITGRNGFECWRVLIDSGA